MLRQLMMLRADDAEAADAETTDDAEAADDTLQMQI